MSRTNLQIYDQLRRDLPDRLEKEDFFHLKQVKITEELIQKPFDHDEIPIAIEGTNLSGVGFYAIHRAPAEILDHFAFDLTIPLPQLFCYRNPHQVYVLAIEEGFEKEQPIHLALKHSAKNIAFTLLIHVGENAKATVIEHFEDKNDRMILYNHRIFSAAHSSLRMVTIQNLSSASQLFEFRETQAERSATVHWLNFQLGAKQAYGSLVHTANGEGAELNTDLLCRTHDDQDYHFDLKNIYKARNGRGRMMARGAALDKSRLGMHGCIKIERTGGGTDAHLTQDSLLLSKDAKIKATPSLEIDTNDVKAAHGASVSNLSDESLFYLSSRGIEKEAARKMMTQGFLTEQLNKINDLPELKEKIKALI